MNIDLNTLKNKLVGYFDLSNFLIPQEQAEDDIRQGVSFRGTNIIILIIAIFIASLGLNTNSTAVIIGAMLISPLMGPIIGIGLSVGVQDFDLLKRSMRNLMMATVFSVATSCVYFMISPVNEGHSELLARTSPSIYDVFIGFFGGAAGILAVGSRSKGNVIPGVAIATALMPPLCTVGYGLATFQLKYFFGALYLFFINSVFIACATTVGVKLMKYKARDFANEVRARKVRQTFTVIVILTMLPAVYLTYTMLRESIFQTNCSQFVAEQMNFPNTQVLSYKSSLNGNQRQLTVTLVGQVLPVDSLTVALDDKLPAYHLQGTNLRIIQGEGATFDTAKAASNMLRDVYEMSQTKLEQQQVTIDSLRAVNVFNARNDSIGAVLAPELRVLFPQIKEIAVTRAIVADVADTHLDTMHLAIVQYNNKMSQAELTRFRKYLEARLQMPSITIVPSDMLSRPQKKEAK
ncbi:MAG: TIGR00341 family protein [Muribaculum sp.]|nr:TIGR00341 family protein [Muribaculaceae bacterium]MCM1081197.1 TIGR00341 family protein [Muribaculum sp.]